MNNLLEFLDQTSNPGFTEVVQDWLYENRGIHITVDLFMPMHEKGYYSHAYKCTIKRIKVTKNGTRLRVIKKRDGFIFRKNALEWGITEALKLD
jgi:hypothetical protein